MKKINLKNDEILKNMITELKSMGLPKFGTNEFGNYINLDKKIKNHIYDNYGIKPDNFLIGTLMLHV